jgi:3-isopropylmalate dehydrogenase
VGRFEFHDGLIGGAAIDASGDPLPPKTLALCRSSDAVLLGAVGGPKWDRAEEGLLRLRRELKLFANLRPIRPHPTTLAASPLKPDLLKGVDLIFVRELTGGLYFGARRRARHRAVDTCVYTTAEIERVVQAAARLARARRRRLVCVDKANVLETSRLWRQVAARVLREEFPGVHLEHLLVDSFAMHLLRRPADFDVIVTENMFGDILTDEASVLAGSLGMLPSASLGDQAPGLYEPVHGSAPDIAGRNIANPYGAILSAALLLRHSLPMEAAARTLEAAVSRAMDGGALTRDLGGTASTDEVGAAVRREVRAAGRRSSGASGTTAPRTAASPAPKARSKR